MLRPKIEGLPDDHPSKPRCWLLLSRLFRSVGNYVEYKHLLIQILELWRERENDFQVAQTLRFLADANWRLHLYAEGIPQAEEALEIYQRHDHVLGQADSWKHLARLLYEDKKPEAAEAAAFRAIDLLSDKDDPVTVCQCHRVLGDICHFRGDAERAIDHFEKALEIASSFAWQAQQFWILCSLAELFFIEGRPDDAHAHVERAKSHAVDSAYLLGRTMRLQAYFWYKQRRLEEAKSEALGAAGVFEKLRATKDVEECRKLLRDIEEEMNLVTSGEPELQW
jgi:tetratricopeptide (TPR) repeat protein